MHQANIFPQQVSGYFSVTEKGFILHMLQQCGYIDTECMCLTDLPAVQICLYLKMCLEELTPDC